MSAANLYNLIIYSKAKELSKDCLNYFYKQKFDRQHDFLINQLLRAITSVGANIAEGYGRYYQKNYRQFLAISRGSSFEVDYWLEMAISLKKYNNDILKEFKSKNIEIMKMLTSMMKKLERRMQS